MLQMLPELFRHQLKRTIKSSRSLFLGFALVFCLYLYLTVNLLSSYQMVDLSKNSYAISTQLSHSPHKNFMQ